MNLGDTVAVLVRTFHISCNWWVHGWFGYEGFALRRVMPALICVVEQCLSFRQSDMDWDSGASTYFDEEFSASGWFNVDAA